MKKTLRILLLPALLVLASISLQAQTSGSNSPYSRYGWGNLADDASGFNKAMAGAGIALRKGDIVNQQNPAAYSEIDSLTFLFDAGISLQNCMLKAGGKTINAKNSTLDYLETGFRLGRGLGFSLGLRQFSNVGYDFSSEGSLDDIDGFGSKTTTASYNGEGGLHKLYAGIGWRPIKPLSIGMNANYIWGDYTHSSSVTYSDNSILTLRRIYKADLSAFTFDFGVQYEQQVTKKDRVTIGATYGIHNRINQRATFINMQSGTSAIMADTTNVHNAFQLPTTIGVGLSWNHANQWTVALDYTMQKWSKCRFPELVSKGATSVYKVGWDSFKDRHKFAAGVEYIPNPRGNKVKHHICYRAGASYTTPYTKINGDNGPTNYLVTLGVGLPIVNQYSNRSVVNIAAQYEHSDAKALNAIKEDYFRLCLGITFNANWFSKWKVQ